jgi:Domain of Unknown Function (DUF1080)
MFGVRGAESGVKDTVAVKTFGHYWNLRRCRPSVSRQHAFRRQTVDARRQTLRGNRILSRLLSQSRGPEFHRDFTAGVFSMSRMTKWIFCAALAAVCAQPALAADNELTPQEKADGWELLFNGKDYSGWRCNNGRKIASKIEDNSLVPYRSGGYLIIYEKEFGDFVVTCDVKMEKICNSGVFVRVGNPKDPVQTGFEVQVASEIGTGKHDFGAIYDLLGPKTVPHLSPEWNTITVTCKGPHISAAVNGETVAEINCDEWTTPHRGPDGSRNKFSTAIKDFPRRGYIGLQDHGHKVWFKNVKIRELK